MEGCVIHMVSIQGYRCSVEIIHQTEIMVFFARPLYIVYQNYYGGRKKNKLSSMENRVWKISISVMGKIYDLQALFFAEEVAECPYVSSSVHTFYDAHFMVIYIKSVMGESGDEVGPPILPDGGTIDISPGVHQNIFTLESDFGMHTVVVAVGGAFSKLKLCGMGTEVISLVIPA